MGGGESVEFQAMAVPQIVWLTGVLGAAWLGVRKLRRYLVSKTSAPPEEHTEMIRCARCAVFVPKHLAVERNGRWYCGAEHAHQS